MCRFTTGVGLAWAMSHRDLVTDTHLTLLPRTDLLMLALSPTVQPSPRMQPEATVLLLPKMVLAGTTLSCWALARSPHRCNPTPESATCRASMASLSSTPQGHAMLSQIKGRLHRGEDMHLVVTAGVTVMLSHLSVDISIAGHICHACAVVARLHNVHP